MSRIGKKPVVLPSGVTAKIDGKYITIKGPKGELKQLISKEQYSAVDVKAADGNVTVTRSEETSLGRTEQGLIRALIQNMVVGVVSGYTKTLDIVGVGYKAELKGKVLGMSLGFSHPLDIPLPAGINVTVEKGARVIISGIDKKMVGELAASLRRLRPPEPYKGKGVRYADEIVKKKVGKAAAATTGGK